MQTRKPLIALTPYHNTEKDETYMRPAYPEAIRAAGGIPVILPLEATDEELKQLTEAFDAFLFTGGPDIHPFFFGEQTQLHCGNVSLKRDRLELRLLALAMETEKPVLGICRGAQLLNIGLGGDIYQDLPSQFPEDFPVAHTQPFYYDVPSHTVDVVPGTLLAHLAEGAAYPEMPSGTSVSPDGACAGISADAAPAGPQAGQSAAEPASPLNPLRLQVNSMHHQAVRCLAPGLIASGFAPSALIEAIEKPDYPTFFLGVQWHPEYLWKNDPAAARIFQAFVKAAVR